MGRRFDMHVHTLASDGRLPLTELVKIAEKKKNREGRYMLKGFVVSDHDTLEASRLAATLSTPRMEIIPGLEL